MVSEGCLVFFIVLIMFFYHGSEFFNGFLPLAGVPFGDGYHPTA